MSSSCIKLEPSLLLQDITPLKPSTLHLPFLVNNTLSFRHARCRRRSRIAARAPIHIIIKTVMLDSVAVRRLRGLGHVRPSLEWCRGSHIHHYMLIDRAWNTNIPRVGVRRWSGGTGGLPLPFWGLSVVRLAKGGGSSKVSMIVLRDHGLCMMLIVWRLDARTRYAVLVSSHSKAIFGSEAYSAPKTNSVLICVLSSDISRSCVTRSEVWALL